MNILGNRMKRSYIFLLLGLTSLSLSGQSLFSIVITGTPKEIQSALVNGADINARDEDGWTPLMLAALASENPEVITVLLEAGADAGLETIEGKTAFDYAEENEHIKGSPAYWELNDRRF